MDFTSLFLQQLANGVVIGAGYALLAVGLTLVFGILHIINFAHGEFYMLGAFITFIFTEKLGLNYILSGFLAVGVVVLIALIIELISVRPLIEKDKEMTLLATFAVSIILINLSEIIFGNTPLLVNTMFSKSVHIGSLVLTQQRLVIIFMGAVIVILLALFLKFTTLGKIIRATAQNRKASELVGIDINKVYRFSFALGCGLAAMAGVLLAPLSNIYATMGQTTVIKGFVVVVLGGLGSMPGAILGGVFLGVVEALAAGFISSSWKDLIGFSILIIVLLFKPYGLLGRKGEGA